jgi:hypothetical protein
VGSAHAQVRRDVRVRDGFGLALGVCGRAGRVVPRWSPKLIIATNEFMGLVGRFAIAGVATTRP